MKELANFILIIIFICGTCNGQQDNCSKYEWKCNNGECIDSDKLCDGNVDCRDGSDETAASCVHVRCPNYSYRCAYGACVNGRAECNNIKDCADNSDEESAVCPWNLQKIAPNGNCSKDKFQCDSGQCIPDDSTCDGKPDCPDGSDETLKICSSAYCPSYAFRCGYGGCISGNSKCDGIEDCHDGSDETRLLCGINHTIKQPTENSTRRPTQSSIYIDGGCRLDYIPNLRVYYESDGSEIRPGDYADNYALISYKCDRKHFLEGSTTNVCENGKWTTQHAICTKYCSNTVIDRVTIQSTCEFDEKSISCNQPLRPGTKAKLSCRVGYKKPDKVVHDELTCDEDGEWNFHPYSCEQICGTEHVPIVPFISGGGIVPEEKRVPWHVPIYQWKATFYEQICGGTIITAKVVVSAAHCFWDVTNGRVNSASLYRVAAGKYYRDYNHDEPLPTQFFNITELRILQSYQDSILNYINDIAILVLDKYISFAPYIKPICLEWRDYNNQVVPSNVVGTVAGWGHTADGKPSDVLRSIDLLSISFDDCRNQVDQKYRFSITGDKFCVNTENGTVCQGDSGGGFAIPKIVGGEKTYFLWGIVSTGIQSQGKCIQNVVTTFTNIQFYKSMIIEFESKFTPK